MGKADNILENWLVALKIMHIAHHRAASYYSKWHIWLGIAVVVLSATVGTSLVASASKLFDSKYTELVAGFFSFLAASLAGAQTFMSFETRVQKHHAAAAYFGKVRRELEQVVHSKLNSGYLDKELEKVRTQRDEALQACPNLPSHIHDPVQADTITSA